MSRCVWQDPDEIMEPCTVKIVRARKAHRCCECGDPIAVGDLHEYVRGLHQGYWQTYRTCARCMNIHTDYFVGSRVLGGMVEDFEAEHDFDYRDGIPVDFAPCREEGGEAAPQRRQVTGLLRHPRTSRRPHRSPGGPPVGPRHDPRRGLLDVGTKALRVRGGTRRGTGAGGGAATGSRDAGTQHRVVEGGCVSAGPRLRVPSCSPGGIMSIDPGSLILGCLFGYAAGVGARFLRAWRTRCDEVDG